MGLNLSGLKTYQKDLESRSSKLGYFKQSEIGEETDVRILPPTASLNGMYFFEQQGYWFNKKFYVSPKTFGETCPIEIELESIRDEAKGKSEDAEELAELLDSDAFSESTTFLVPILLLDASFDSDFNPTEVKVSEGKAKVLQCGPMLLKAINKIATSRQYQNGTDDGFTDREKGYNLMLGKTGKGLKTEYSAQGWRDPWEMDEKYYNDTPDVVESVKNQLLPDDYLVKVVRNYFYGEALPERPKTTQTSSGSKDKDSSETAKSSRSTRSTKDKESTESTRSRKISEEDAPKKSARKIDIEANSKESEPKNTRRKTDSERDDAKESSKKPSGGRNLMADLNDM